MRNARTLRKKPRYFISCAAAIAAMFLLAPACAAQAGPGKTTPAPTAPDSPPTDATWFQDFLNNPQLMSELGKLVTKLQQDVRFPPARTESRLLPLLPESTLAYAAFSNYGEALQQALTIFKQQREESATLRDLWQREKMGKEGPKLEEGLGKAAQFLQYLGGELVVSMSGTTPGQQPKLLMVAEVRKPGLKTFLQQRLDEMDAKSRQYVHLLDPKELAAAEERLGAPQLLVLVRPDFVVGALDVGTLRDFTARLERSGRDFVSTPFGQRGTQAYEGGVTVLGAVDLHKILSLIPATTPQGKLALQQSGFGDMKYLVWEHKSLAGQNVSDSELSFTGPRHGAASWLAAPGMPGSLDFVSPKAIMVGSVRLKNLAQIFDDVKEMATASEPNAFAPLAQAEQGLGLSLRNDLLGQLGGEITVELDDIAPPKAAWRAILRANDPARLQQTFSTLLAAAKMTAEKLDDGGIAYYTLQIPNGKTAREISYAFSEGYLLIGSSQEAVAKAVLLRRSGESLGQSKKFQAALPPGHPGGVSALLYEDPIALTTLRLRLMAPEAAAALTGQNGEIPPVVMCAYGEEAAIRGSSSNAGMDAAAVLVVAAIAIPNLLRSRIAANEASAVGSIRTVITAQVVYDTEYPERGYARDLATLGPNPEGANAATADHADLIDAVLGDPSCTAGAWCTKTGYRFTVTAICKGKSCKEYVVTGTPVSESTGTRNFCSTSDGVIHSKMGPPLASPVSATECRAWPPLQ